MRIDNFLKPVYTEDEARRIAELAAETAVKKVLQAMHLDIGIAQTFDNSPRTLTVKDVAGLLGLSLPKAYELTRRDGFPTIRVGRRILVNQDMLMEWMRKQADRKEKAYG